MSGTKSGAKKGGAAKGGARPGGKPGAGKTGGKVQAQGKGGAARGGAGAPLPRQARERAAPVDRQRARAGGFAGRDAAPA